MLLFVGQVTCSKGITNSRSASQWPTFSRVCKWSVVCGRGQLHHLAVGALSPLQCFPPLSPFLLKYRRSSHKHHAAFRQTKSILHHSFYLLLSHSSLFSSSFSASLPALHFPLNFNRGLISIWTTVAKDSAVEETIRATPRNPTALDNTLPLKPQQAPCRTLRHCPTALLSTRPTTPMAPSTSSRRSMPRST